MRRSINNLGQVIGFAETSSGIAHSFIWDAANGLLDLTPKGTARMAFWSINDKSQIIALGQGAVILLTINENRTTSSIQVPLRSLCTINNNGYVIGEVPLGQSKVAISTWHENFGQKSIFISNTGSSSLGAGFRINDLNQAIIVEPQEYTGFLKKFIPALQIKNYLVDPNLGTISLDGYISLERNENLSLRDINNNGWIIGAIQSTKDPDSKGVLFEPIPEKMERINKKSGINK